MSDFLNRMAAASRERVSASKRHDPETTVRQRAASTPSPPVLRLSPDGFDVIAEYKRRAPSSGWQRSRNGRIPSVHDQVTAYAMGGAAAISVLTEPHEFCGTFADLRAAVRSTRLPIMRKDFITDPYQVYQTRAAGGAGILLIVRILDDAILEKVVLALAECGMFALFEAFDETDISRAADATKQAQALGVISLMGLNARNLETLETERSRLEQLRSHLPLHCPRVAESSIFTPEHVGEAARCGFDGALVGSALMQAPDPTRLLSAMIASGQAERASQCTSV